MTEEQKYWFILGALYRSAISIKKEGLFKDLKIQDVVNIILEEWTKDKL